MGLFKKKENGENTNTNTNNTASQGATSNKGINVNDARSMRQMKSTYTPKTTTTKSRLNATEAQKRDITQKVQTKNANKSINVNNANQMRDLKSSYADNRKAKINETLSNKTSFNDSRFIAKKKENPYQQDIDNYDKQLKEIYQAYRAKSSGKYTDLGQYDKYSAQELNDMYANIEKERNSLKRINDTEHAINKQLNDTNKDAVYKESDIFDYNNGQVNIKDFTKELSYLNNEINTLQSQMDLIGFDEYGKVNDEEKYQSLNSEKYKLEKQRDELSKKQSYQDAYVGKLIFDNAVANKDTETLSQLHNQFGSYNDNVLERTGKATAQIPVNIYATALSTVDIVRDYVGDKLADKLEETANFLRENGQIDEKRFNEFLEDAKKLSNFEADNPNNYSTEMRELANQLSYESMNGLNGVDRFVAEGLSSTANFFTQFYLFGATGSLVSMGLQSGSQKYFENLQKGYDKDVALANAIATGLISYATEKIGMDNFVSILNGTAGKGAMAQLVNQIAQGKGNIAIIMNNVISQGLAEGLEEMVEGNADYILDSLTAKFFNGEPVEYSAGDLFYGMLVGAFSGAITGGMGSIDTYNAVVNTREQYNQLRNDVASLMQMRSEAVLNKEDTTSIDNAIKIGEMALNNFEKDAVVSMAVTLPQDMVDTNLTPEGVVKETTNILGPNIDQAVTDTLAQEQLENNVYNIAQEFMSYNNINEDAREFINLDENRRQNVIDGSKYADRLNIRVGYSLNVPGDGYYDPQTKTIMINPNSQLGEVSTLIHELTHFNEDSSIYKTLSELAEESYGVNAKERVQEIKNEYKKFFKSIGQDPNKVNDDYAQREFTAIETQDQLGNDEFVQKLIHYNESLAYRIYDNIKAMTSSDVKTRLENTFARAFRDAQNRQSEQLELQYSIKTTKDGTKYVYLDNKQLREDGTQKSKKEIYNDLVGKKFVLDDGLEVEVVDKMPSEFSNYRSKDMYDELFNRWPKFEDQSLNNKERDLYNTKLNNNFGDELLASKAISPFTDDIGNKHIEYGEIKFMTRTVPVVDENGARHFELTIAKLPDGRNIAYAKRFLSKQDIDLLNEIEKKDQVGHSTPASFSNSSFSLGLSNVNSEAKTNLDNFLKTNEEIIEGLGLLDGYTGVNTQASNLDTNLNYANQTREQVLNDNIENMLDSVDDELEYFLENYEITQDELGDYRDELVGWLTDPYSMEGSAMEGVSYETRDMFGELMADYLIDKYSSNVYQAPTYNSDGQQLTPQQQEYFKDSKIRNDNGDLLVVYHGTDADFNEFNMRDFGKDGETAEGFGIYLTDNPDVANAYGERSIKAYANITNPATSFSQNINQNTLEKLIKATVEKQAEEMVADGDYQTLDEAIRDTWVSNYTNTYEKSMDDNYQDVAKSILRMNDNDMDVIQEIMSGMGARNYQEAYDFYDTLKKTIGIDGFETEWVANDGTKTKIFIAFDSNQVKDTDNSNPSSSSDIRYSIGLKSNTDSDGKTLSNEQQDYFKNTKITNDKGQLLRVYHGTRGDFYIFDRNQGGQSNSKAGIGFWFTPSKQGATNFANDIWYGDNDTRVIESYLNITNPYIYETIDNSEKIESLAKELYDTQDNIKKLKKETNPFMWMDDPSIRYFATHHTEQEFIDYYTKQGYKEADLKKYLEQLNELKTLEQQKKSLEDTMDEVRYDDAYEQFRTDIYKVAGQSASEANTGGIGMTLKNQAETLEKYRDNLINAGYDGIIIKNTRYDSGNFGGDNDQYVAFYPEQIKDANNLEPTTNPDIRYSLGKTNESDTQNSVSPEIQAGLDANQEAIDKYGAYGLGNKPVRNAEIAKETDAGPTSRFWNNLANSEYVSDEEAQKIQARIGQGLGTYERTSNKQQQIKAREMIRKEGLENSLNYILNSQTNNAIDIVFGKELLSEMNQKGLAGTKEYNDLQANLAYRATMAGQALQAYNTFRTQTPEGQIITIRSEIERIQQALNERFGQGAYDVQIDESLIEDYMRARTQEERDEIRLQLAMNIADQIPPTLMEQLSSWRHLSMLFNPRTWIKNASANFVHGYINEVTRAMRSVAEGIAHKIDPNVQRQAGIYNPLSETDRANYKRAMEDYDQNYTGQISKYNNYDIFGGLTNTDFGKQVMDNRKQFTWNFLNNVEEFNARMMSDRPAVSKAYAKSLVGYLKVNNLTFETATAEQMQQAREFAMKEALYATFNSDNWLANQITSFERQADKLNPRVGAMTRMVVESFIPFKRTPFNILKTGYNYSPAGLVVNLFTNLHDLRKGRITANTFIDNLCQGLTGSSIFLLGALLSNLGIFRTKDDDKDRKKYFDQDNGEQDYSINWDGGSYTIDWLDPMIIPLAMGAEAWKLKVEDGKFSLNDIKSLAIAMAEPLLETSMMSGITKNLKSYANDSTGYTTDILGNAMKNYASQYIPSIMGALARTMDDTRRSTYVGKDEQTLLNNKFTKTIKNKIPGLSMTNDPYIDKSGNPEKQEDLGMGIAGRAVLQFLSPGYYSEKDIDEYDEEMYRLYDETGDLNALPSSTNKSLTHEGETYNFSSEQYTQWQETRWQTEAEYVNQFMDSNAYENLTDEERVETIKDIRTYAQKVAKKQFLESQGYKYTDDKELADSDDDYIYDKQLVQAQGALDNDIELYAYYDYLNNSGSKQAEKMAYLEESGLSQKQKEYLWSLNDYKKSYADVYASVFGSDSSKSTKKKKSSKSSKKGSSGKSSSKKKKKGKTGTAGAGGGLSKASRVSTPTASRMATGNKEQEAKVVNKYLSAYSNSMRKGNKNVSKGSAQVVCYKCKNRVTPVNGKCPICGTSL